MIDNANNANKVKKVPKGCNRARVRVFGEVRVIRDNGDGTFTGESVTGMGTYSQLCIEDAYFFEFR